MPKATSIKEYIDSEKRALPADTSLPIGTQMQYMNEDNCASDFFVLAKTGDSTARIIDINTGCCASHDIPIKNGCATIKDIHNKTAIAPYKIVLEVPVKGQSNLQVLYDNTQMPPRGKYFFRYGDKFVHGLDNYILVYASRSAFLVHMETGRVFQKNIIPHANCDKIDLEDMKRLLNNDPALFESTLHKV